MITLPTGLNEFMKGQNLDGLKPFALLYRNKWDSVNNKYALEDTPIDISALIAKPNTLSMTLDVNEVAQYNANNVTLTLSDTKNYFVEGTPNSYFPEGYQIYGSRIVLYYGTDGVNRTPLFTGVIKDLPTHKPENYQVDVKLVSPLEMLKDIEAKDFSDKFTGETLTYKSTDSDGHRIYWTTGTGVGGFDAVYADGTKLFEGVDYETDQLNALGLPAIVTIINSDLYSATITADYYTWKTGLTVEQIVAGLVGIAGYDSGTEDIRNVVWNTGVRTPIYPNVLMSRGYVKSNVNYNFAGNSEFYNERFTGYVKYFSHSILPKNFIISFNTNHSDNDNAFGYYTLGTRDPNYQYAYAGLITGIAISFGRIANYNDVTARQWVNGTWSEETLISSRHDNKDAPVTIRVEGNVAYISGNYGSVTYTFDNSFDWGASDIYNESLYHPGQTTLYLKNFKFIALDDNKEYIGELTNKGVLVEYQNATAQTFSAINASFTEQDAQYSLFYRYYGNSAFSNWEQISLGSDIGVTSTIFQTALNITQGSPDILNLSLFYLGSTLTLQLVNLSGSTVLEALQDFALISGYEFGVDRNGIFFFRPRVSSPTPTYILDHDEIVKVDTVKKNLSDFFTKLTLTFAQVPLEFYANTGERPTLVDKYGIINKEIDKPDIVNYDNPELAQAIGPQLLEVYSALPNVIQVTGKLNLALELGDIVSLRRNFNLVEPNSASDFKKWENQQTFYRAGKITGMNYNFSKRQITYTLRDVSNANNSPIESADMWEFVYDLPIQLGAK